MSSHELSERQFELLRIVAEGEGRWDARRIDITFSSRFGADGASVLSQLEVLKDLGLVSQDVRNSGVGGRWAVTAEGRLRLG